MSHVIYFHHTKTLAIIRLHGWTSQRDTSGEDGFELNWTELSSRTAWLWRWRIYDLSHVGKHLHPVTRYKVSALLFCWQVLSWVTSVMRSASGWFLS